MSGRGKGGRVDQVATIVGLLGHVLGVPGKRNKKRKPTQCYRCQKLGHVARVCSAALACLKCAKAHETSKCDRKKGDPASCVNCGGAHAANSRSCSYLRSWSEGKMRRQKQKTSTQPQTSEEMEEDVVAPSPPKNGLSKEVRDAVEDAVAALKSAMAEGRAAMKAELAETRRELRLLREALAGATRAQKELADAATQTVASLADAGTQTVEEAAMETVEARSTATDAAQETEYNMEVPMPTQAASPPAVVPHDDAEPDEPLPLPDGRSVQRVLKKIALSLRDNTYPHLHNPYPFTPPHTPKPSLPHVPFDFRESIGIMTAVISRKELKLINARPIFTHSDWWKILDAARRWTDGEIAAGRRRLSEEDALAIQYFQGLTSAKKSKRY